MDVLSKLCRLSVCTVGPQKTLAYYFAGLMATAEYAELVMKQFIAGKFYIVSHAFNLVGIEARWREIEAAGGNYAQR